VRDIATDADDATIVSAVIGMGRNLNQRVIAEGVETREQLAFLRTTAMPRRAGLPVQPPIVGGRLRGLSGRRRCRRYVRQLTESARVRVQTVGWPSNCGRR
jgi:predicted signal transduction protein with EAL and GGDEF domain